MTAAIIVGVKAAARGNRGRAVGVAKMVGFLQGFQLSVKSRKVGLKTAFRTQINRAINRVRF